METLEAASTLSAFVRWEEVYVSSDKGRREVHYYLKRRDGTSDLAVIGRGRSPRHMSYHHAKRARSLLAISPSSSLLKLRSRREVVEWLNFIVSGLLSQAVDASLDSKDPCKSDETSKNMHLRKLGHYSTDFSWLGAPWTCRKRGMHYQSFCRNGVKISVHDFIYILAEENKRLVAHLDDMYEDSRGNKMVVVRWFHKIDEVDIVLPHNYNDREIFYSLCLQDLSIECIDGFASVLSPQHYEKFSNAANHNQLQPFVCQKLFDNDEIKLFDITHVEGYWKQDILRYMYRNPPSKDVVKLQTLENDLKVEKLLNDGTFRTKKRRIQSRDGDHFFCSTKESASRDMESLSLDDDHLFVSKGGSAIGSLVEAHVITTSVSGKECIITKSPHHLAVGSEVEVLSQDSGIRGCWFRAMIIKKHKDKVKIRYLDIKDAADESNNLEEWIFASKTALPDVLGARICGRTVIRPNRPSIKDKDSCDINVGSAVDVWWHDGWWEGITLHKDAEDKIRICFPGENKESIFSLNDLRRSQEWLGNIWEDIKERPDLATSILSGRKTKESLVKNCDIKPEHATSCDNDGVLVKKNAENTSPQLDVMVDKVKEAVYDLSKDALLAQLKWKSSGKRRRGNLLQKLHCKDKSSPEGVGTRALKSIFIPNALAVEHDNCKFFGDSPFSSSVVPLTSMVMSR